MGVRESGTRTPSVHAGHGPGLSAGKCHGVTVAGSAYGLSASAPAAIPLLLPVLREGKIQDLKSKVTGQFV